MIAKEKIVKLVVLVEVGICLIAFMHFQFKSCNCVPAAWLSTILLIIALLAVFIKNVSEWKRFLAASTIVLACSMSIYFYLLPKVSYSEAVAIVKGQREETRGHELTSDSFELSFRHKKAVTKKGWITCKSYIIVFDGIDCVYVMDPYSQEVFRYPLSDVYPNYAKEGGENHVG